MIPPKPMHRAECNLGPSLVRSYLQKLQRKLREQGRKVKKAEEELQVLKRTRKEVDDTVSVWKGKHYQQSISCNFWRLYEHPKQIHKSKGEKNR